MLATQVPDEEDLQVEVELLQYRVINLLSEYGIVPDDVQYQMLGSHLKAMVWRSHSGEPLPDVDLSLFDEISSLSLQLATQVTNWFSGLAGEEAHLLSVHFEVAKENELSSIKGE